MFSREGSALTGIGLTTIREAISNGTPVAHKQATRTIILPDDLRFNGVAKGAAESS
jgi:hypothetical protein